MQKIEKKKTLRKFKKTKKRLIIFCKKCNRNRNAWSDNFDKEHSNVEKTSLICWSGGKEIIRIETDKRIWIREGGHYEYINDNGIETVTGDCHLKETFSK